MSKSMPESDEPCRYDTPTQASVAERIRRNFDNLTPSERKAAHALQANYPIAGLESLATFAQRAGVSHPSILRFVAKLGYSGYPDFQAALRTELEARLKSPLAKHAKTADGQTDNKNLLVRHAEVACDNIRQSIAALPLGEFEGALALLASPRNQIYLLGGRFTNSVASHVYMHLRVLRPNVEHIMGPPVSWPEYLLNMDKHAVVLVYDIRRYQPEVIRFAEQAAKRGSRIILITDSWLSPIVAHATHVLSARIEAPSNWDSLVAISTLSEALITGVGERSWARSKQRIHDLEQLRDLFEDTTDNN